MVDININLKKYIHDDYYQDIQSIVNHNILAFTEDKDEEPYPYNVMIDPSFTEGIVLRVDKFFENIQYIKEKGAKDCDNVLIDISNKKIYIIEIKRIKAFQKTSREIFEQKEMDTKIFLEYFFMLNKLSMELSNFDFIYIRWSYGSIRRPDRAYSLMKKPRVEYFKYDLEDKDVYKVDKKDTLNLSDMFLKYEMLSD